MTWTMQLEKADSGIKAPFARNVAIQDPIEQMVRSAWMMTDDAVLTLSVCRMAQMLDCELTTPSGQKFDKLELWRESGVSGLERSVLSYVEQFLIDPNSLTERQREEILQHMTFEELINFVHAVHAMEAYLRSSALLAVPCDIFRLRDPELSGVDLGDDLGLLQQRREAFQKRREDFGHIVVQLDEIDDLTTESCRLRNASMQQCQFCMNVRRKLTTPSNVDDLAIAVARYEISGLPAYVKIALRLTDAFVTYPARLSASTKREAVARYSPQAIIELAAKLILYHGSKPVIALATGITVDPGHTLSFYYDEAGDFVLDDGTRYQFVTASGS